MDWVGLVFEVQIIISSQFSSFLGEGEAKLDKRRKLSKVKVNKNYVPKLLIQRRGKDVICMILQRDVDVQLKKNVFLERSRLTSSLHFTILIF